MEQKQVNTQMTSQEGGCQFGLSGKRMPNGVRSASDLVGGVTPVKERQREQEEAEEAGGWAGRP